MAADHFRIDWVPLQSSVRPEVTAIAQGMREALGKLNLRRHPGQHEALAVLNNTARSLEGLTDSADSGRPPLTRREQAIVDDANLFRKQVSPKEAARLILASLASKYVSERAALMAGLGDPAYRGDVKDVAKQLLQSQYRILSLLDEELLKLDFAAGAAGSAFSHVKYSSPESARAALDGLASDVQNRYGLSLLPTARSH